MDIISYKGRCEPTLLVLGGEKQERPRIDIILLPAEGTDIVTNPKEPLLQLAC